MGSEEQLKGKVEDRFESARATIQRKQRLLITLDRDALASLLLFLKSEGLAHLAAISCVDWLEQGTFQLTYHVASYSEGIHAMVEVNVPREKPKFISIVPIYKHAQTYEREIWEMFGVEFEGNARLVPFLLDRWQNTPPMRKDFDTRQYVHETFGVEERRQKTEEV